MERVMSVLLWLVLGAELVLRVACNAEGDCLNALKTNLADPNNVLGSWNSNDQSPCTWFNVTCNAHNSVIGVHLGSANISGQLVPELGQLENLQYLILYNNRISGNIPEEFGNLTNLVSLDLRFNDLNGSVPATLGKLTKLCILLLNNNSLSGEIPMSLTALMSLQILDLSNNQFTGAIPVNGSFLLFFPISLANNQNEQIILPPPTCPASAILPAGLLAPSAGNSDSHVTRGGIAAFVTLGGIATFSVFLCSSIVILLLWSRRGRFQPRKPPNNFVNQPDIHLGQLQTFSFNELQAATDNFSDKNILGKGGFSKVYKGRLDDGSLVAVKRIEENRTQSTEQQFQTELQMISLAVHRNLLRPCGFCMTTTERLLVYPFMVNGSIASCVRDRPESQPPLDWKTRKRIALGVARGLAYLHDRCDPKIIHRDVKATNIFLDEEFEAVIGDFGLATLMGNEDTRVITAVCGTIGHIAPEYFSTGNPSEKTDVFAYGILLLEVITKQRAFVLGRRANDEDVLLLDWVKRLLKEKKLETLVDSDLRDAHLQDEVEELIQLALLCTRAAPANRPQMSEVVRMLEGNGLAEKWEEWQQEEMACQDGNHTIHPSTHWVIENLSSITPDVLSGPR